MSVSRNALVAFLLDAKRSTYAAQGDDASVVPLLPGSRQLEYRDGMWFYRDICFGSAYFVGQETVYAETSPIWAMCYAGGLTTPSVIADELRSVYASLRAALRQIGPESPYRGPRFFRQGIFVYQNESQGDVARFWGIETIIAQDVLVYHLHYGGGLIR